MAWYDALLGRLRRDDAPALPGPAAVSVPAASGRRRDSTINPFTGLGGPTDKGAVARPNPWVLPLTLDELDLLYEHNGIARRLVEIVPQRACRRGWSVPQIGTTDETLQTWSRTAEAMSMARLHGGSVMLLVTDDDVAPGFRGTPATWLAQPIDLQRVGRLVALQVFDAWEATPLSWETDPRELGFRLPSLWQLSSNEFSAVVHASRVIHFRGARRPPSRLRHGRTGTTMPDTPYLQIVWDEVRRVTETMQGGAILAQEIREAVLKIVDLPDIGTGDEADAFDARLSEISRSRSVLGITVVREGEDFQTRANPPTGFDQLSAAAWEALAAVTGIPQVILMGSTPGGLNTDGESSWEGFRQLVSSYQDSHRNDLQRLYRVIYAAQDGPTRGREPEGWSLTFAALDEPNEGKVAETRKTVAAADALYVRAGVLTPEEIRRSRFNRDGWSMELLPVPPKPPTPPVPVAVPPPVGPAVGERTGERAEQGRTDDALDDSAFDTRHDMGRGVCILVPVADVGLRAEVEAAIGQPLRGGEDPHVTVLMVGSVADPSSIAQVVAAVREEAARASVRTIDGARLTTFAAGWAGTPVVVEFTRRADLRTMRDRLLRRLAHIVTAEQFPTYRPHVTLGYAPDPIGPDAAARLAAIDVSALAVPVSLVEVRGPGGLIERIQVGRWR